MQFQKFFEFLKSNIGSEMHQFGVKRLNIQGQGPTVRPQKQLFLSFCFYQRVSRCLQAINYRPYNIGRIFLRHIFPKKCVFQKSYIVGPTTSDFFFKGAFLFNFQYFFPNFSKKIPKILSNELFIAYSGCCALYTGGRTLSNAFFI